MDLSVKLFDHNDVIYLFIFISRTSTKKSESAVMASIAGDDRFTDPPAVDHFRRNLIETSAERVGGGHIFPRVTLAGTLRSVSRG